MDKVEAAMFTLTVLPSLRVSKILLCVSYSIFRLENGLFGLMEVVLSGVLGSAGVARAILQLDEVRFALLEVMLRSS